MGGLEARMGRGKTYTGCFGEMWEMRPLGRLSCRWEKIIIRIFRKWDMVVWTGYSRLRIAECGVLCECDYELTGSMKCGKFLDQLKIESVTYLRHLAESFLRRQLFHS
jgi:hypothetical protein